MDPNGNVAWFCTGINPARHDPTGSAVVSCDGGFQGWALDADNLFAQLGIAIVIKKPRKPGLPQTIALGLLAISQYRIHHSIQGACSILVLVVIVDFQSQFLTNSRMVVVTTGL